jgi:glycerol-3-phosphate acyltransferase PlsY
LAAALAGYLAGSIPSGYLIGRARGIDIRQVGSGNIGATNVLRVLGKPAGILVLVLDALKGALACWLLPRAAISWGGPECASSAMGLHVVAGLAAILGHNYTCWLRFKGGKGIATSAGVLLIWMPKALGLAFLVWLVVFGVSRYVSLASVAAATTLPLLVWATGGSTTWVVVAAALGGMAVYKHRANLQRLRAGSEPRFGRSKPAASP